ncbi:hypothetical protein LWI28_022333 [Acer negundo]|uniref:RNase H type-1 domain-containing protein n=1 Tax=Acer negundo TaxID=4023 RepID=A0AAD5I808_ACENE|nr:hypothetical protein LWI28_022333 [Acer negundo]
MVSLVSSSWFVVGDFNAVLGAHEALGSRSPTHSSYEDFRLMIEVCDLVGIHSQGARFTWVRGRSNLTRVERRLDKVLVSDGCISCWQEISCVAFPRIYSDHCPLLVRLSDFEVSSHRLFPFQSMWLEHPDFIAIVCKIWSSPIVGRPLQVVIYKLRSLKKALKSWNWEVFGNLNSVIARKSIELHSIQLDLSNRGFSYDLFMVEASVHYELDVLLRRQKCFYRDRSRVRWLRDGDWNTSFFHASIKCRKYRNTISALSINGVLSEDRPTIRDHIISYYSNFFSSDVSRVERDLSIVDDMIPSLVTAAENAFLTSVPSADDIHDALFAMDVASTPGPDGFSVRFYQRCWDFIKDVDFLMKIAFAGLGSSWLLIVVFVGLVVNLQIIFFFIVLWRLLFERQFSRLSSDVSLPKFGNPSSCRPLSVSISDQVMILWKAVIHAVIWGVWTARNQWIFEGKLVDFRSVLSFVWSVVSKANRLDIGCMLNCMDNLLIFRLFSLRGRPSKAPVIKSVIWSPSAPGWIKVNTDGAAMGSLRVGGCSGIFRNCRVFVKGLFAIPLGQVFAFEVELLVASSTVNFAWKYGWHRIWLESDFSYMVQLLSSHSEMVPWRVRQAW